MDSSARPLQSEAADRGRGGGEASWERAGADRGTLQDGKQLPSTEGERQRVITGGEERPEQEEARAGERSSA